MKVVSLICIGICGFGAVTESRAFGPSQTKSLVEATRQIIERENQKLHLVAVLEQGSTRFCTALEGLTNGDRGLSCLLEVAMESDLELVRSALAISSQSGQSIQLIQKWAYLGLLVEILFEYSKEDLRRYSRGEGGFLYLECIIGRLSIPEGWGAMGFYNDPIANFNYARKTRSRRNLDRYRGQLIYGEGENRTLRWLLEPRFSTFTD